MASVGDSEGGGASVVLYEDGYLRVTDQVLVVKRYYFPTLGSRVIPWSQIEWVRLASQAGVQWYTLKMWGMGIGTIWWGWATRVVRWDNDAGWRISGLSEILATNIVIKTKDSWLRAGSFVEDAGQAMAAINQAIYRTHPHVD
ncbi:hypothetical protein GGF46_004122 [Coemansia sp. RSA 552]|nr:hypothetical protein GGF46_004122 [Coemansia sp. RSA 552]